MIGIVSYLFPTHQATTISQSFFFFNDPAPTEIYTLPLHAALPTPRPAGPPEPARRAPAAGSVSASTASRAGTTRSRSEEHTSELQSPCNLVCRLLLEKKKKQLGLPGQQDNRLLMYLDYLTTSLDQH